MAKVLVQDDCIAIRASLLERMMLAEKSRKLPLSRVRGVDPHPPLLDMMVHWADQGSAVWLGGVSSYEGHMIPSTRNPRSTLAIELEDELEPRVYVELDDEAPEEVAAKISRAIGSEPPPPMRPYKPLSSFPPAYEGPTHNRVALEIARAQQLDEEEEPAMEEQADVTRRELSSEQTPPLAGTPQGTHEMRLDDDHDLARIGGWMLGLGGLGVASGAVILLAGGLPGLLVVAGGVLCAALGGVALALVAHHQG
jgi:hypothetical protein